MLRLLAVPLSLSHCCFGFSVMSHNSSVLFCISRCCCVYAPLGYFVSLWYLYRSFFPRLHILAGRFFVSLASLHISLLFMSRWYFISLMFCLSHCLFIYIFGFGFLFPPLHCQNFFSLFPIGCLVVCLLAILNLS